MTRNFTQEEKNKLTTLIREGTTVYQEVDDLQAGLNDTIKNIAEELEIKPAIIKKAIKTVFKNDFDKHTDDMDLLESILHATNNLPTGE